MFVHLKLERITLLFGLTAHLDHIPTAIVKLVVDTLRG